MQELCATVGYIRVNANTVQSLQRNTHQHDLCLQFGIIT